MNLEALWRQQQYATFPASAMKHPELIRLDRAAAEILTRHFMGRPITEDDRSALRTCRTRLAEWLPILEEDARKYFARLDRIIQDVLAI